MDYLHFLKTAHENIFENAADFEAVSKLFSEHYVAHAGGKTYSGHDFILKYIKQLRTAIPDLRLLKLEILMQTETTVCYQRKFSGTHKNKLKGISASGEKVTWYEMVVSRFEENKITEEWLISDLALQLMVKFK